MNAPPHTLSQEFEAALNWWRDAGVDMDFSHDATAWLAEEPDSASDADAHSRSDSGRAAARLADDAQVATTDDKAIAPNLLGESPPDDLTAFQQFWMEAPGLDAVGPRGRIPPRGKSNTDLMILVVDPEDVDVDALLSGPQGRLLERMLWAMGIEAKDTYIASALPRHTPMADTASLAAHGMSGVLDLHIKLAAPKRILAFGKNILPLLGHELTKDATSLREINQDDRSVPLIVSEGLESLMSMPRLKARFWRRWIEWSADTI